MQEMRTLCVRRRGRSWASLSILSALAVAAALGAGRPAGAATYEDPDWPCIQRKVPEISLGQMWAGPPLEGNWRDDPEVVRLAEMFAERRMPLEAVEAAAAAYAATLDLEARPQKLAQLFAAVLSRINRERGEIVSGIGRYAHKQTDLAQRVEAEQAELRALEAAPEPDLDRVEELQDTLAWDVRVFRERAQSLTYVCESPVLLEQRAFAIARLLAEMI